MWGKVNAIEGNMSVETLEWESRVRWGIGGRGCKLHWAKKQEGNQERKMKRVMEAEKRCRLKSLHYTALSALQERIQTEDCK